MNTNVLRAAILAAVGALVVAAPVLGNPSPAQAHNYLVDSTPASGETLTTLPDVFEIRTNGPLLVLGGSTGGFALEVRDAAGAYYSDGCVTVEGPSMTEKAALGDAGQYTVLWQVVSTDGHTVSGQYDFTWAPAPGQVVSEGASTPPDCNGTAGRDAPAPTGTAEPPRADADLGDVLWISGAIGAVLVAALVTFLVLGRRRKPE
ncbi:hypothetical protein BH11ACT4_BH11ACT4_10970 [soil metagenome]